MARIEKTVFISYRRKDQYAGLAVYQDLTSKGYDVFLDYTSIPSGDFEQNIVSNIRARAHFVLILTPTALDRCSESGDWLRREIETAIDEKRNIIPLFFDGFNFGLPTVVEKLTGNLALLSRYNGLDVPSGYFMEAMERLRSRYLNVPLTVVLHPMPIEVKEVVKGEQIAADKALEQEKDVIEELIKPAEDKLEHLSLEKVYKEEEHANIEKKSRTPQSRVLEAAIEKQVIVNVPTSLFVWIKRLESASIVAVVGSIDEDIVLDEDNVKSKGLKIEFPIKKGVVQSVGISLRLIAHEFTPSIQRKKIIVPPEGDSEVFTFIVTPKKVGKLLLSLEVIRDDISIATRTLKTTAVNTETSGKSSLILVSIPITVFVQGESTVMKKQFTGQKLKKSVASKKRLDSTIISALIGAIGTIIVAVFSVFGDRLFTPAPIPAPITPTATLTLTAISTFTLIPTDTIPPGEPTSTPAPPTDTPEPTLTFTAIPPVAIGSDWMQGCISSLWVPYPPVAVTITNGCLREPVHVFAADNGALSFLQERSGPIPVEYYGIFAPLPEKGTVTFKVSLSELKNVDLWMGVFSQPDIKSNGLLLTIPAGDVEKRVLVQKEIPHYITIFTTRDLIEQGEGYSITFIFDTLSVTGKVNPFVLTTNPASLPITPKWLYLGYKSLGGYHRIEGKFFDFVITSD